MNSAPLSYSVRGRTSKSGSAELQLGSETIRFDSSWATEPVGLPGPAELLAASFAACLLKNLERSSQLLGIDYESADVNVVARRQDTPPRFVEISYELRVTTNEPQHRIDLIHQNLKKFGTVYNTLSAVCDVHGLVTAVDSPG